MTGIYFRVIRNGCALNLDFSELTADELRQVLTTYDKDRLIALCVVLNKWMREELRLDVLHRDLG